MELSTTRSKDRSLPGLGQDSKRWPSTTPLLHQLRQNPTTVPLVLQQRTRLQVWLVRVCSSILVWTCIVQILTVGHLWGRPHVLLGQLSRRFSFRSSVTVPSPSSQPPPFVRSRIYHNNGYLKVSCNGGLNQMRSAICDMVAIARLLNLTLVVPELDKTSFWADPRDFGDIFNVEHFINSLRGEVHIVKRLPRRLVKELSNNTLVMPPVSWSIEAYYLHQILPLFDKHKVIHFNKTDARLPNNGISKELQKLRCYVNYYALKFTEEIEVLGKKLVHILRERGNFVALHLRYEMDMLAFSGCTHGCSVEEAEELKKMRYAYPRWREKDIVSGKRRMQGMCPLTPEETSLILQALDFKKDVQIYIASGEIYGSQRRLQALQAAFPRLMKKEVLLNPKELQQFQNHSSLMAALDYMVSIASDSRLRRESDSKRKLKPRRPDNTISFPVNFDPHLLINTSCFGLRGVEIWIFNSTYDKLLESVSVNHDLRLQCTITAGSSIYDLLSDHVSQEK